MDPTVKMLLLVLAMASVTYVIRVLPLTLLRKKIKSQYIKSVLYYIPFAVLSAMTFPAIFYSTGNVWAGIVGTVVAIIASLTKRSLILVAGLSCLAVFILLLVL